MKVTRERFEAINQLVISRMNKTGDSRIEACIYVNKFIQSTKPELPV